SPRVATRVARGATLCGDVVSDANNRPRSSGRRMLSVLFFEFARTLPARAQRRTPMLREAHHKFRIQLFATAAWTSLLASVIACGSEAPDEKIGGGLGTAAQGGTGGSVNVGK